MVEHVIQVVKIAPHRVSLIDLPDVAIGRIERLPEAAEQLGHGHVGLAIARNKLNATYEQAEDLRALMPGAVLVTIPEVRTSGVRVGRAIAGVLGGLVLAGIFAGTVAILGIQLGWWGEPAMIQALLDLR